MILKIVFNIIMRKLHENYMKIVFEQVIKEKVKM